MEFFVASHFCAGDQPCPGFHYLNRTTYHGCRPSVTFSVALVEANSSAPDCCNHTSSVVWRSFRLKPPTTTYCTCRRICSGGSVRKKCSTRPLPNGCHSERSVSPSVPRNA